MPQHAVWASSFGKTALCEYPQEPNRVKCSQTRLKKETHTPSFSAEIMGGQQEAANGRREHGNNSLQDAVSDTGMESFESGDSLRLSSRLFFKAMFELLLCTHSLNRYSISAECLSRQAHL